jgi:hypothetical protein
MVFKVSFSPREIEQLYLTYRNNPKNYKEIKRRLYGDGAKLEFKKNLRGRLYFMATLSGVAIASSFFSIFAEHWGSLGAIWIIWTGFMIGLGVAMYISYKHSFLIIKNNELFFEDFEQIAALADGLEDFIIDWNLKAKNKDTAIHPVP